MISDNYLRALNGNYQNLIDDLMVDDIIPNLRSCKSFTKSDEEIIQHKVTSEAKNETLLEILKERDNECFELFLDILCEKSEHLAAGLYEQIRYKRVRRLSESEYGNILILGGVPERLWDYISRKKVEVSILEELKNDTQKPILIHGEAGCGKSSVVAHVLHSEGLFHQRFSKVCWMSVGNIKVENLLPKLRILSAKLDSKNPDPHYNLPEEYMELITKKIRNKSALLVLDDIWNNDIMKYFMFPVKYLVTSRNSKLFTKDQASIFEVPRCFEEKESLTFLSDCIENENSDLVKKVIKLSHGNPFYLSGLKNLLKSNRDYITRINSRDVARHILVNILKDNIEILNEDMRRCYTSLAILREDETVSVKFLSTYWNINEIETLNYINYLFDNHMMSKKWMEEYDCNMYGIHDTHSDYLKIAYQNEILNYQSIFINRHKEKYKDWLKFDHRDPCFFNNCALFLTSLEDIDTLRSLFTDFTFLASKIVVGGIKDLLFDYETYRPAEDNKLWDQFNTFFMRHNHRFVQLPKADLKIQIGKAFVVIIQLALFEDQTSEIFKLAPDFSKKSQRNDFWIWHNSVPSMKIWEASNIDTIDLIDINHIGILLITNKDRLGLYDIKTGKCLFNNQLFMKSVILCKFLKSKSLEFLTLDVDGNIRCFNISNILGESNDTYVDDDDMDFTDNTDADGDTDVNFNDLRKELQRTLSSNLLEKCQVIPTKKLKKSRSYVTGFIDFGKLFVASIDSNIKSDNDSNIETLIECYSIETFSLNTHFKVPYPVQKIIHNKTENGRDLQVYILKASGLSVDLYDDLGCKEKSYSIDNMLIMDFLISGRNIFLAISNKIYKNSEVAPIFSIPKEVNITRISACHDQKLMVLCLTNKSVQIWNLEDKVLLYSVKGFDFSNAQFECCDHLITTEQSNVAKWSMDHLKHDSKKMSPNQHVSYRLFFHMYSHSPSTISLIVQKYNNDLHFIKFENDEYLSRGYKETSSKANCFTVVGNYAFIGFLSSHLQIYDLTDLSLRKIIDSVNNVNQLMVWSVDEGYWNIVVNYDTNKIKIFRLSMTDFSILHESKETNVLELLKLKIFKIYETNKVMIGVCRNYEYILYDLNEKLELEQFLSKPFNQETNIIDFDVNDSGEYFCLTKANGILEIWSFDGSYERSHISEVTNVLRLCKFRPTLATERDWTVVATVNDDGEVVLYYFNRHEYRVNGIIEDNPPSTFEILSTMTWTNDGNYLLVADNDIRKWKVPLRPQNKDKLKHALTKLYTHSGGIQCLFVTDNFICTVDRGGYLYILKKL